MKFKRPNLTRLIDTKGVAFLKRNMTHTLSELQGELSNTFRDTLELLDGRNAYDGIQYASAHDRWNHYGMWGWSKSGHINNHATYTWAKGKVLSIDLGVHSIGREHALPHPAIVMEDFGDLLVVVPLTSEKKPDGTIKTFDQAIENVIIRIKERDPRLIARDPQTGALTTWWLKNDTIALTHQIRVVSKNRIEKPIMIKRAPRQFEVLSLGNTPFFEELEKKIAKTFGTGYYDLQENKVSKLEQDVENLTNRIKELETEKKKLEKELTELQYRFHEQLTQQQVAPHSKPEK